MIIDDLKHLLGVKKIFPYLNMAQQKVRESRFFLLDSRCLITSPMCCSKPIALSRDYGYKLLQGSEIRLSVFGYASEESELLTIAVDNFWIKAAKR